MIGHQRICPARNFRRLAAGGQHIAERQIVGIIKENLLATIAALGDVMGQVGDDEAGDA